MVADQSSYGFDHGAAVGAQSARIEACRGHGAGGCPCADQGHDEREQVFGRRSRATSLGPARRYGWLPDRAEW